MAKDAYYNQLLDFKKHLDKSVEEMLDIIDNGGDYEDRFGIEITVNGKTCKVELHADAYQRLSGMLETEMDEYTDVTTLDLKDKVSKYIGSEVQTTYGPSKVVGIVNVDGEYYVNMLEFGEEPYSVKLSEWNDTVMEAE